MKPLLEAAQDIVTRFQHAAQRKTALVGAWQQPYATHEVNEPLREEYEELQARRDELWDSFESSLTVPQSELHEQLLEADGPETFEAAHRQFTNSLADGQRQQLTELESMGDTLERLRRDGAVNAHEGGLLVCTMPPAGDMSAEYEISYHHAVAEILDTAINLSRFNTQECPPDAEPVDILPKMNDRQFVLRGGHTDPDIDLDAVSRIVDTDIAAWLSDPAHWEKVQTRRGAGYQITVPEGDEGLVFKVVRSLMNAPEYHPLEAVEEYLIGGAPIGESDVTAMETMEDEPAVERRITLSGKAAGDILGLLGVNPQRIRENRRQRGG